MLIDYAKIDYNFFPEFGSGNFYTLPDGTTFVTSVSIVLHFFGDMVLLQQTYLVLNNVS